MRGMFYLRVYLLFLVCGLAGLASGCGGGGSTPDAAPADAVGGQEAAVALPYCTSQPAVPSVTDLSGTWVMRMAGAEIVNSPIGAIHTENVFYILVNISQSGTALALDGRYCDRTEINPPNALVPVIVPPAWAHTENPVQRTGTFALGADGVPVMTLAPFPEYVGYVGASATDPLPTQASDPRVFDEDGDGNPGITVVLNGQSISGSIYTVQEQITTVSAIVVAPDRVVGALSFTSLENILGGSNPNIASLFALSTTTSDPVVCNSGFAMVKIVEAQALDGGVFDGGVADGGGAAVDGGAVGCEWVRANEVALFP